jgi:nitric oxide reductase NorQ protein/cobaltochelatase CobS
MADTAEKRQPTLRKKREPASAEASSPGQVGSDKFATAFVPEKTLADRYVHRQVYGVEDFKLLDTARRNHDNVLLMGDTGSGKTMVGAAYAAKNGDWYYSLPCDVSVDPTALFGKMSPTEEAARYGWIDGPVTQIVRTGGVLNISEVNFMPPRIAASLYPLLDGRRYVPLLGHKGEVVHAHPSLLVIADMNPNYRGTIELNDAFRNRFPHKVAWGYDTEVEKSLVKSAELREVTRKLRAMGSEIATPVSTNLLMEFERMAVDADLSFDYAVANFVMAFRSSERDAVSNVFDMSKVRIQQELGLSGNEEEEEIDLDSEEFYFTADDK